MRSAVEIGDITEGMVRVPCSGIACSLIARLRGIPIPCRRPKAFGRATTRTVVISSVVTLVLNFVLTAYML